MDRFAFFFFECIYALPFFKEKNALEEKRKRVNSKEKNAEKNKSGYEKQ